MSDNPYQAPESDVSVTDSAAVEMSLTQIWFSFEGRVNRKTYWLYLMLAVIILGILVGTLIEAMGLDEMVVLIFYVAIIWPSLAVQAKRWHDTNRSAWWILIGIVPIIGSIWVLVVNGFFDSVNEGNRFGAPQA